MAGKKRGGGRPTPPGATTDLRRAAAGVGLVPGFSNDEQLALGLIHAQVLGDARQDLLRARDALRAESWASATWGLAYGRELVGNDLEAVLGGGLVQFASHQRAPESLALLRSLAVVAPPPYDADASRAAEGLAAAGVGEPAWSRSLGAAHATRAVVLRDPVDDDGISVFIGYAGVGDMPGHSVAVYVDNNLGGIAKDAYLGPELDEVEAASVEDADGPLVVEAVTPARAAALVRAALDETDRTWDPPISDTFRATRALLLARLRALPHGSSGPARARPDEAEQAALVAEFATSPEARHLDLDHVAQLGRLPLRFSCEHVEGEPLRFSPTMVELFCTDWAPRQLLLGPDELVHLPDVLRAWIRFVGRRRRVPAARLATALSAVDQWGEELPATAIDPSAWGPAQAIVEELERRGIDPADEDALADFLDELHGEGAIEAADPAAPGSVVPFPGLPGPNDDLERFAEELAGAEAEAAQQLRADLAAHVGRPPPAQLSAVAARLRARLRERTELARSLRSAAGLRRLPARDERLLVRAAAAYLIMVGPPEGLGPEELGLAIALDHVEWLVLVTAALDGPLPVLDDRWVASALRQAEPHIDDDDIDLVWGGFVVATSPWPLVGVLDEDRRLTEVGRWVLPRALSHAWGYDFDTGRPTDEG